MEHEGESKEGNDFFGCNEFRKVYINSFVNLKKIEVSSIQSVFDFILFSFYVGWSWSHRNESA